MHPAQYCPDLAVRLDQPTTGLCDRLPWRSAAAKSGVTARGTVSGDGGHAATADGGNNGRGGTAAGSETGCALQGVQIVATDDAETVANPDT